MFDKKKKKISERTRAESLLFVDFEQINVHRIWHGRKHLKASEANSKITKQCNFDSMET